MDNKRISERFVNMVNLVELKDRLNKILQKAISSDKVQARVGRVCYTDTAITMNVEFRKGNLNEIGQLNFEKYCDMLPPQKESYNTANRFILDGEVYYKFKGKKILIE